MPKQKKTTKERRARVAKAGKRAGEVRSTGAKHARCPLCGRRLLPGAKCPVDHEALAVRTAGREEFRPLWDDAEKPPTVEQRTRRGKLDVHAAVPWPEGTLERRRAQFNRLGRA